MDKEQVLNALQQLKQHPKRKFEQSYDLIINLKNIVIKQDPVDVFVTLHNSKGRKIKVAAFVDQQLADNAKQHCDFIIRDTEFQNFANNKNVLRKLAEDYDYFIAQANLMPKVAAVFGKVLGTKGKMPNPKMGCVVPPSANIGPLVNNLNYTVRLVAKKGLNLQCIIGKENQSDAEVCDNILTVYQAVLKHVPNETQNIKNVQLKLTMSKPVKL